MLKLENVSKYYDDFLAVDNLSFEVKPGEIFGLLGVNGAGKTTTFRMIIGLIDVSKGSITLDGKKIGYDVTNNIGFLTEERSLLTKLTVKEQCLFYGRLKGMTNEQILEKLDIFLEKFDIKEYKDKKIKELSKGNQQKIQFITAIINDPKLLILDEPFSGLDPINVELFKEVILDMSKKGSMIIFSSHRMEHVELFCKKLAIMVKGKTVISGYLSDIKEIEKISGVVSVITKGDSYEIKIESSDIVKDVFDKISKCKNITKFVVEEPSLNEIFISKVGESYE